MEYKEFKETFAIEMLKKDFEKCKNNTFKIINNNITSVVDIQKSNFGEYVYINIGLYLPISNNLQFPKITDCQFKIRYWKNTNSDGIEYGKTTKEFIEEMVDEISEFIINNFLSIELFKNYIEHNKDGISMMFLELKQYLGYS